MREELERLVSGYRRDGMSRRELATGLAAATAGFAAVGGVAEAQTPFRPPVGTRGSVVPAAAGGGADDYLPIQTAIDDTAALGGGRVVITQPLLTGSTLVTRTGVELVGEGPLVSSISAHPSFSSGALIYVEPDAHHVILRDLTLTADGGRGLVDLGAGCNRVLISGVRFSGYDGNQPWSSCVRLEAPPDPGGSNTPIRRVLIENCEFEEFANGVKITGGAEHVSVTLCDFSGMHRRCIWLLGSPQHTSRHIQVVGNTMLDFPYDSEMSNPVHLGTLGSEPFEYIHVSRNVVIGNGSYHGPGGFGTPDHFTLKCAVRSQVLCNVSIDSGESGFTMRDGSDLLLLGNASVRSDVAGFAVINQSARSFGLQFISNLAWNNGQNRGGAVFADLARSGFLIRNPGVGIHDTQFISNRAWDDQRQKTQAYALAIEKPNTFKTLLSGNLWRAAQHELGAVLNRGTQTREAQYTILPKDP